MTEKQIYNLEFLQKYCIENNIILTDEYKNIKINRNTLICGKCIENNCENIFSKTFRNMVLYKAICKDCIIKDVVAKRRKTCIEKYGCENPQQNEKIKNKTRKTCIEKYGCENPGQNEIVKNKMKTTNLLKYNSEYPSQNNIVKNKIKNVYHSKSSIQHDISKKKFKETCIEKYGAEHPLQSEELMEKASKRAYKIKTYKFKSGKEINCQGYEPFALNEITEYINEDEIITGAKNVPEIWYYDSNNKKHRHYVDIYVLNQNKCIEVKSTWTYKNNMDNVLLKQIAGKNLGYNYEIWVYDNKGNKTIY